MSDDDDTDLEVIDLEPADPRSRRRDDTRITTGVGRRRGPVLLGVVVIVALVGSAVVSLSDDNGRGSTSTTRAGQADTALDQSPVFPFRVGAEVLTGGSDGLQLIDTDTGRRTVPRVSGLPEGRVTVVAASGSTVAVRVNASLYWFSMQERVARSFQGDVAFPATRRGYLWFAGPRSATQVPGVSLPIATTGPALGATNAGLLLNTKAGVLLQSTGNPSIAPRLFLRAPVTVIGVHPERVAWLANDCGVLRCPVRVTEIAGGATSTWLQLEGRPNPLMLAGSSAVFSPDGNHLAIVVPDERVTSAKYLYVADLRTRTNHAAYVRGRFDQPARPGSDDATGSTIDWTRDSRYLLLAPAAGSGPIAALDPATGRIVPSRAPIGMLSTAAVVGSSTVGPLDLLRRGSTAAVDTGGPTTFGTPGLTLIGADDDRVDVVNLASGTAATWALERAPITEATGGIARVVGGWLVVRAYGSPPEVGRVVELLRDRGGGPREVANGVQVFASKGGTQAWIVDNDYARVQPYDPIAETLGTPIAFSGQLAAVDAGLLVASNSDAPTQTRLDLIDPLGSVHRGVGMIDSPIELLAAGGTTLVFRDEQGMHAFDTTTSTDRVITPLTVASVALSPNGKNLAWIHGGDIDSPLAGTVRATRLDDVDLDSTLHIASTPLDRVLVADDGTVLFTNGNELRRGRVDGNGSNPVYGFAPDPEVRLALG